MSPQNPEAEMSRASAVTAGRRPQEPGSIHVIVAESARGIREFLAATLDHEETIELVASCADDSELEAALATALLDVLIADVRMPPSRGDVGLRIARRLRERDPRLGVILLGQYAEPAYILSLLESGGARAYLLTERLAEKGELVNAIKTVAAGGVVVDRQIVDSVIEARARVARSPLPRLDRGERELLALIVEGQGDAAIASGLRITEPSVATRVQAILGKLGLPRSGDGSRRAQQALAYLAEEGG
jgi:DNA-binding NarL/FixJ family response regulator